MRGQAKRNQLCALRAACALLAMTVAHADDNGRGTRAIGLANAFAAVADNAWSIFYNPAGLSTVRRYAGSLFFVPEQFGLSELKTTAVATSVPMEFATFGLSAEQFGFDLYKESKLSVSAGVQAGRSLAVGCTVHVLHVAIERYGSAQSLLLDVGTLISVNGSIDVGVDMRNVTAASLGHSRERLPQVAAIGLKYAPFEGFIFTGELEKEIRFDPSFKFGIEQRIANLIAVQVGTATNPSKFAAGVQIIVLPVVFGYATYSHPELGWTHQIELTFQAGS